jgi:hypothetical protein
VHSGIVWRDKIYGDRRQICERVEVSTIKYQLFRPPKMKYLLLTLKCVLHAKTSMTLHIHIVILRFLNNKLNCRYIVRVSLSKSLLFDTHGMPHVFEGWKSGLAGAYSDVHILA